MLTARTTNKHVFCQIGYKLESMGEARKFFQSNPSPGKMAGENEEEVPPHNQGVQIAAWSSGKVDFYEACAGLLYTVCCSDRIK